MSEPRWEVHPLNNSDDWGPSPFQDLLNLWVKLTVSLAGVDKEMLKKRKFYYVTSNDLDSKTKVYKIPLPEGLELYIFHPDYKNELLSVAMSNHWEPVDYQEFCKTPEWKEKFGNKLWEEITKVINRWATK